MEAPRAKARSVLTRAKARPVWRMQRRDLCECDCARKRDLYERVREGDLYGGCESEICMEKCEDERERRETCMDACEGGTCVVARESETCIDARESETCVEVCGGGTCMVARESGTYMDVQLEFRGG
ncbi:hypothetical protein ACH3XW_49790 [Acanthocheilonema viteae]